MFFFLVCFWQRIRDVCRTSPTVFLDAWPFSLLCTVCLGIVSIACVGTLVPKGGQVTGAYAWARCEVSAGAAGTRVQEARDVPRLSGRA